MKADKIAIFATLCEEDKMRIDSFIDKIKLSKGKVLYRAGDRADFIYYIVTGAVSISEKFYVAFSGEMIGTEGAFAEDRIHAVEAKTDELTELLRIPTTEVLNIFSNGQSAVSTNGRNANIMRQILQQTNKRLLFSVSKLQAKKGGSPGSIANLLLYYVDTGQAMATENGLRITKRLTESDIAECCHCDRSTVSRTLSLFNELGIIYKEKRDKYITIVSREQLNDYCLGRIKK